MSPAEYPGYPIALHLRNYTVGKKRFLLNVDGYYFFVESKFAPPVIYPDGSMMT